MKKENVKILAIIPARGGSKGIPYKNIVSLCAKPLLAYTCEAALKSTLIDRLILSTDDRKIAAVGKKYGVEVPFLRPKKYSQDKSPAIDVIVHALGWFERKEKYSPDAVLYLQPTSPLRTTKHINEAIKFFNCFPEADSLVSVIPLPHHYQPIKLMKLKGKYLKPLLKRQGISVLDRHGLTALYARNGPAVLITKYNALIKQKSLYGKKILPYIMKREDSVDIDDLNDLKLVEFLLQSRKKGK